MLGRSWPASFRNVAITIVILTLVGRVWMNPPLLHCAKPVAAGVPELDPSAVEILDAESPATAASFPAASATSPAPPATVMVDHSVTAGSESNAMGGNPLDPTEIWACPLLKL